MEFDVGWHVCSNTTGGFGSGSKVEWDKEVSRYVWRVMIGGSNIIWAL